MMETMITQKDLFLSNYLSQSTILDFYFCLLITVRVQYHIVTVLLSDNL